MATIHMSSPITLQNDMDLLNMLTSPTSPVLKSSTNNSNAAGGRTSRYKPREAPLDPLLLVAAISSGPHVTRHHYHHHHTAPTSLLEDLLPDSAIPNHQSSTSTSSTVDSNMSSGQVGSKYKSQQAPRSQRMKQKSQGEDSDKENQRKPLTSSASANLPPRRPRGSSLIQLSSFSATTSHNAIIASSTFAAGYATNATTGPAGSASTTAGMATAAAPSPPFPFTLGSNPVLHTLPQAPLHVQCMARTRIPTPHGPAFLHLYRNNKDNKEHLAFVIDPVQLQSEGASAAAALASMQHEHRFIRSASLDAKWSEDETELDRLTRGAYIGRLTSQAQLPAPASSSLSASDISAQHQQHQQAVVSGWNSPPLVRIHSECFTGETIGSMRCDCGEQLDEALRLISLSAAQPGGGRGAVIYLRQEGRGIGLLDKIRAYNLQDMGHDTVQANLLLGHGADERRYDIAAAIMRDLGLLEVELLTNNPDKVVSLEKEGVKVMKRREMVPRTWQMQQHQHQHHQCKDEHCCGGHKMDVDGRLPGATLIGGGATHGPELEKYLRTKIERMGHMLELPREAA